MAKLWLKTEHILTSTITSASVKRLGLVAGEAVSAIIKASDVPLATT
ncbi:MAG: TOBE domain-containing protein [Desulforhopalus sp.]